MTQLKNVIHFSLLAGLQCKVKLNFFSCSHIPQNWLTWPCRVVLILYDPVDLGRLACVKLDCKVLLWNHSAHGILELFLNYGISQCRLNYWLTNRNIHVGVRILIDNILSRTRWVSSNLRLLHLNWLNWGSALKHLSFYRITYWTLYLFLDQLLNFSRKSALFLLTINIKFFPQARLVNFWLVLLIPYKRKGFLINNAALEAILKLSPSIFSRVS